MISEKDVGPATVSTDFLELTFQKPAVLHALVLNLIKHEQYRSALEELETCALPLLPSRRNQAE